MQKLLMKAFCGSLPRCLRTSAGNDDVSADLGCLHMVPRILHADSAIDTKGSFKLHVHDYILTECPIR